MLEIYAVRLTGKIEKNLIEQLLLHIHESKRLKIKTFFRQDNTPKALIGDILARVVICKALGIDNSEILFNDNGYGKPLLLNYPNYHFSISHSGDWIVYAANNREVGIDVQKIKPVDYKIAKRFFSPLEYHDLMNKTESEKIGYFYDLWTLKESYIKAIGRGLGASLGSFSISVDKYNISVNGAHRDTYYFRQYCVDNNYKLSVCSMNNKFPEEVICIRCEDLLEDFMKLN